MLSVDIHVHLSKFLARLSVIFYSVTVIVYIIKVYGDSFLQHCLLSYRLGVFFGLKCISMFWLFLISLLSGQQFGLFPPHLTTGQGQCSNLHVHFCRYLKLYFIHYNIFLAISVPNITFTTTTGRSLGESLTFNCTVDVLDDLYNINATGSIVRNGKLITSSTGSGDTTAMETIYPLRSSDAGDYQCIVNITQPDIDYEFNGMETAQVILTCMLE